MNPLFQKKTNEEQEPFTLPQDDNPQGDMLDPATQQVAQKPENVPAPKQVMEEDKQATGEQSEGDITREEYPLWFLIADALGGEVEPFDVYQGPYIQVPGEGRLFIISPDGYVAQVWNEKLNEISAEFTADSENEAVDAALSVLENPPANTLPYGAEREQGPDTSEVPDTVPATHPDDWVPEFSEEDKVRLRGMGQIKGSKSAAANTPWDVYLNGKWINRVFTVPNMKAEEVKRGLVDHDGLNPAIEVYSGAGRNVPGSVSLNRIGAKNPLLKKAVGAPLSTGQYGQNTTCYKCKQPIQEGQTVTWEGGMEAHAGGCPPPQTQNPAQEQSRIMFPRGQQPKKPQMNTQTAPQTPQRAPIKPMYSSAEKVATRRKISGFVPATSWGVPQEYAHQVARTLAEAGMRDFDVATDEVQHIAFFSFGNEVEMEVCADLVCQYFAPQIAASKGKWIGWQCRPERQPGVPEADVPFAKMNSEKEAGYRGQYREAIAKLQRLGIKTTGDLDKWIKEHPQTETKGPHAGSRSLLSRYDALKELAGEDAATWILHDLATDAAAKEIPNKRSADEEIGWEELLKKQGAAKQAFDPTLATFVASWVSLMVAKWVGNKWKERFSGAEQKLVAGTERMLEKSGIYDLGTLDAYAAQNGQSRYKALAKVALTNLVLAAAVTFGLSAKDLMTKATQTGVEPQQTQQQTQQDSNPNQMRLTDEVDSPTQQEVQPTAPQLKDQQRQQDRQVLEQIREQDKDRNPQNIASLNPLRQQNLASLKIAKPQPTDYDGGTIEEQVASLMERRAFSELSKGKGWATYERHDGDIQIKVYFKGNKVEKAVMDGKARQGFEGLFSLTQTFGD